MLRRNNRDGKVSIDSTPEKNHIVEFRTPGESVSLELDGPIYLGGTGATYGGSIWPPSIWNAVLKQGFVGCLRDLVLSGKAIDIAAYARQQDSVKCFNLNIFSKNVYIFVEQS